MIELKFHFHSKNLLVLFLILIYINQSNVYANKNDLNKYLANRLQFASSYPKQFSFHLLDYYSVILNEILVFFNWISFGYEEL